MIPVATTTIDVLRRDNDLGATEDPWEDTDAEALNAFAVLEESVRAVISVGGGNYAGRTVGPGDSEFVNYTLLADPCDLQYLDEVEDKTTGQRYQVEWAISSPGVAGQLASVRAGLSTRKGI
jgi:hypothetical protein